MPFMKSELWKTPTEDTVVWRYMSYKKFLDLLCRRQLFFNEILKYRQGDKGDKLEGATPTYNATHMGDGYFKINFVNVTDPYQKGRSIMVIGHLSAINCWGIDNKEVARKWNEYGKDRRSVAIKSKVKNLKQALKPSKEDVYMGKVNYINYSTYVYNNPDPFGYFMLKNAVDYEWEHELRLFVIARNGNAKTMEKMDLGTYERFLQADIEHMRGIDHVFIDCDLDALVDKVVVSPWAEEGYADEINSLLQKYKLKKEVIKSFYSGKISIDGNIIDLK